MKKTIKVHNENNEIIEIPVPKNDTSALAMRSKGEKAIYTVLIVILCIHIFTLFIPWVWTFLASLKESFEYASGDPFALPKKWKFSNFAQAFKLLKVGDTTFAGMIWNSVWYVALNATLDTFVPACTGYVMSKYKFRGREIIYSVAITCMTIPIVGSMASAFKLYMNLGVYDTPWFVVITSIGGFGGTFLIYYGYFKNISWSYAEAAMMDGAGPYTIFFKVMLPQAAPLLMTYMITGAMGSWGDYMSFVTYMPSWPNLATGLYAYQSDTIRMANYPVFFAGTLLTMIPSIILFCTSSDKIMTNLSLGGLKG